MASELVAGRFKGCLVGGLLGDCLGAPFEGDSRVAKSVLNNYINRLADPGLKVPYKKYTDDTAMTRCVAQSLIEKNEFDAQDMAKRYVAEYYAEPGRGYGKNIVDVFAALRATDFEKPYAPAKLQFGGLGSYGNGGAMRVAPVALFCYSKPLEEIIDMARNSALITHANALGYNGAILQCLAVHRALQAEEDKLDVKKFIDFLMENMQKIEKMQPDEISNKKKGLVYVGALEHLKNLMERSQDVTADEVEATLGNDISAHKSVPTAIFAFLRALKPIGGIEADCTFQRTVQYAISLGGDTDTIASMAGFISGAYVGLKGIPSFLQSRCEGVTVALRHAEDLCRIAFGTE